MPAFCSFWILLSLLGLANTASILGLADTAMKASNSWKQCKELYEDCSVPKVLNLVSENIWTYYKVFDPACLKHDVCYRCGNYKQWTQKACDNTFKRNMIEICHLRNTKKPATWWEKARIAGELGYGMIAWLNIPEDSLEHCLHGARMFYKAVYGFGDGSYGKEDYAKSCQKPCAQLGNPELAQKDYF